MQLNFGARLGSLALAPKGFGKARTIEVPLQLSTTFCLVK